MSMEPELTRVCGRLFQSLMVLGKRSIDMLALWLKVVGIGAARFVTNNYDPRASVTTLLQDLN
jgi:hypothetical protein